jgi:2-(1,2-epoxy-1,2-dihydrophenyl)acetyl-CoA isomerase
MDVICSTIENVCFLKLNRPNVFNSFNQSMAIQLQKELDRCSEDENIRAIVLSGEGKAFCAGQDLDEAVSENDLSLEVIIDKHYNPIIKKIREVEKPVICAVNGVAAGAGANIALSCDIVIAKESASFIQAFSKIGLIPDSGGTFFLPRLIGFQKASALMMLGDKVNAKEAESLGMIYKSVSDDDFDSYVNDLAVKVSKMPTKGLALTKKALNKSLDNDLNSQLNYERDLQVVAGETEDFSEGVSAFLEKRNPDFKGK